MATKPSSNQTMNGRSEVKRVLITQPRPDNEKSPYFELAKKHSVEMDFYPFIRVEGLSLKEFRKQKLDFNEFTAVIFNSRNSVDHFFRICDEMKYKVSQENRYFCITEAVALYLQKFILYRKRKVFFSADGSSAGLMDVLAKYKDKEVFLIPISENSTNGLTELLNQNNVKYQDAIMYRTVSTDIKEVLSKSFDVIALFSPFSVEAILQYDPEFKNRKVIFGGFGNATCQAIENAGLDLEIKAPAPNAPSMVAALDKFLDTNNA